MDIRRLGVADLADYRTIRLETLATEPDFFSTRVEVERERPLAYFADILERAVAFGACVENRIAGVVRLHPGDGEGTINGFFVQPHHRRLGIGRALMAAAIGAARDRFDRVGLRVTASNAGAIAFYHRFGFEPSGTYDGALLMTLPLHPP